MGNPSSPPTTLNQGAVDLDNAVIENAVCGIRVGNISNNTQGGGIVYADNAYFTNNQQAVYFTPYAYANLNNNSYFKACHFIVDIPVSKAMIELQGVQGIEFKNCKFSNNYRSGMPYMIRPNGIYANNSSVRMGSTLDNGCEFVGLERAIYLYNSSTRPSSIYSSIFNRNNIGLLAEGTNNLTVENCQFNLFPHSVGQFGIYLRNSSFYTIGNNNFAGTGRQDGSIGLLTENTGEINHFVKNNSFSGLCTGCKVIGNNGSESGWWGDDIQGLVYLCNKFASNEKDIWVTANSWIRHHQYDCYITLAAGNVFNNRTGINRSTYNLFYESVYGMCYHFIGNSVQGPGPVYVPHNNIGWHPSTNDCCTYHGYVGNEYYARSKDDILVLEERYLSAELVFKLLSEDNENNESGRNHIDWQNPEVNAIVEKLKMHPTQEFIITIGESSPSSDLEKKVVLHYELTNLKQHMDKLCYAALEILANNEDELDIDTYHTWMGRFNTIESEYVLAESYMSVGEFEKAMGILKSMPAKYSNLNEKSHQNYWDYHAVVQEYSSIDKEEKMLSHLIKELIRLSDNNDFVAEVV